MRTQGGTGNRILMENFSCTLRRAGDRWLRSSIARSESRQGSSGDSTQVSTKLGVSSQLPRHPRILSNRGGSLLAGANSHDFIDRSGPHLSVADRTGASGS